MSGTEQSEICSRVVSLRYHTRAKQSVAAATPLLLSCRAVMIVTMIVLMIPLMILMI